MSHRSRNRTRRKTLAFLAWAAGLFAATAAVADQEASNTPHVKTSKYGHFYAKSVPSERYGSAGRTMVYRVTDSEDVLLHTYPWFASRLFLEGFLGSDTVYVVQMGPWARGEGPAKDHLAFAVYKGAELVKRYSTHAIATMGARPSASVSHYTLFEQVPGFRRAWGNKLVFEVLTHDRERLTFDADTGDLMTPQEEATGAQLSRARGAISRLKFRWYQRHEGELADIDKHKITEAELRRTDPEAYPDLPAGYRYIADSIWKPVRFKARE